MANIPVPPNHRGGGRNLVGEDDVNNVGIAVAAGDTNALMLQLIHALEAGGIVTAGMQGVVNNVAAGAQRALDAADAAAKREQSSRVLRPLTRLPAVQWGNNTNVAAIRLTNQYTFSGESGEPTEVNRWLSKILSLASSHTLTFAATVTLMHLASTGSAADFLERMRDEGKLLSEVVQQLEMRYGDLCSAEEARVKCNTMPRKERELLAAFLDRLRLMAKMACRLDADEAIMRKNVDVLVESNIRRVLPSSVRIALEERMVNRMRMGLPAFSVSEVEKECIELEKRRLERHSGVVQHSRKGHRVQAVAVQYSDSSSDSDLEDDDDVVSDHEDPTDFMVNYVSQKQKKFQKQGISFSNQKLVKRAVRKWNGRAAEKETKRPAARAGFQGAKQATQGAQGGPPNAIQGRRPIHELLSLANIERGSCIQCGQAGHMMSKDECPLKGKPLKDKPCAKCGTGLHSADDCPKVYQTNAHQVCDDDSLNED